MCVCNYNSFVFFGNVDTEKEYEMNMRPSILRRPIVANFADTITIATMIIKTAFKD